MQLLISKVQSQLSKIKQRWDNDYSASHTTSKYAVACTTALSSAKTQAASLSSSSSSSSSSLFVQRSYYPRHNVLTSERCAMINCECFVADN
mmetsp:Transcript_29389/g.40787  ORF Transcript_29389/g.40787 Transcript_29389/m.40787 type:complete len:92 (+) Transcript_29389:585-860(+)